MLLITFFPFLLLALGFPQTGSTPFLVSDDPYHPRGFDHEIAVDRDNNIWVIWSSEVASGGSNLYARFYDGSNWSQTMLVVQESCSIWEPQIAVDSSNNIWVVWTCCYANPTRFHIYATYYDGLGWQPVQQIDPDTGWSHAPAIVVTETNELWCSYMHGPLPYGRTFRTVVSRRESGNWSSPIIVSDLESLVWIYYNTAISPDGTGGIWVGWLRACGTIPDAIKVMGSYYNGVFWGPPVLISKDIGADESAGHHQFSRDTCGNVWCSYWHERHPSGFHQVRVNWAIGDTWANNPMTVVRDSAGGFTDIIVDDSNKIWVTWDYQDTLIFSNYYNGDTWSNSLLLSVPPVIRGIVPTITKDYAGHIWAAWAGTEGTNWDVYVNYCSAYSNIGEFFKNKKPDIIERLRVIPNPFAQSTCIHFVLHSETFLSLKIYDVNGRLVKTIADGYRQKGNYKCCWDGRDDKGTKMEKGVYFCHLRVAETNIIKKMIFLY